MRNKCDYTLPTLKKQFPISLQTACPVAHLRKYMARSFRQGLAALLRLADDARFQAQNARNASSSRAPWHSASRKFWPGEIPGAIYCSQ